MQGEFFRGEHACPLRVFMGLMLSVVHLEDHFSNSGDPLPYGVTFNVA